MWYWIVGLSDLMIHSKSGDIEYNEEIEICNDEVFKLHPSDHNNQFQDKPLAEIHDNKDDPTAFYKNTDLFNLVTRETENQEIGTIMIEQELKFMLLRHWTLYESFQHSNYLITQLRLW